MRINLKKYRFTDETKTVAGHTLHRVLAIKDFGDVHADDLGGWIESESNLSQEGNCWIYENVCVYGDVNVSGNALVRKLSQCSLNLFDS